MQDSGNTGEDRPFWDALNANVKNLHAVISGHGGLCCIFVQCHLFNYLVDHGNEWCAREPTKDVIFCFDKHSGSVQFNFVKGQRSTQRDANLDTEDTIHRTGAMACGIYSCTRQTQLPVLKLGFDLRTEKPEPGLFLMTTTANKIIMKLSCQCVYKYLSDFLTSQLGSTGLEM